MQKVRDKITTRKERAHPNTKIQTRSELIHTPNGGWGTGITEIDTYSHVHNDAGVASGIATSSADKRDADARVRTHLTRREEAGK